MIDSELVKSETLEADSKEHKSDVKGENTETVTNEDEEKLDKDKKKKKKKSKDREKDKKHRDGSKDRKEKRHRSDVSPERKVDSSEVESKNKKVRDTWENDYDRGRNYDRYYDDRRSYYRDDRDYYRDDSRDYYHRTDSREYFRGNANNEYDRRGGGDRYPRNSRDRRPSYRDTDIKDKKIEKPTTTSTTTTTQLAGDDKKSTVVQSSNEHTTKDPIDDTTAAASNSVSDSNKPTDESKKIKTTEDKDKEKDKISGSGGGGGVGVVDKSREKRRSNDRGGGGGGGGGSDSYRRRRSPSPRRRDRSMSRDRRRDRSADRVRDSRRSRRSRSNDNKPSTTTTKDDRDKKDTSKNNKTDKIVEDPNQPKPLTLKDIIAAYPGISLAEAAQRLNAHNAALAMGIPPPGSVANTTTTGGLNTAITTTAISSSSSISSSGNPMMQLQPVATMSAMSAMTSSSSNNMMGLLGAGTGSVVGEGGPLTKPHREVYVGNIPPGTTVPQLADFLNAIMKQLGLSNSPAGCVVTAWVSTDGHYAFVEFRTVEETLSALQYLNGLQVGAHTLKVGRPKGYNGGTMSAVAVPMGNVSGSMGMNPAANPLLGSLGLTGLSLGTNSVMPMTGSLTGGLSGGLTTLGTTTTTAATMTGVGVAVVGGNSDVIMVTNIPIGLDYESIRELVTTFGEVRAFNVIKTSTNSQSAVLEYVDPSLTDGAIIGLNKLEIAEYKLAVQRVPADSAAILLQPTTGTTTRVNTTSPRSIDPLETLHPTRILRLSNMTMEDDLTDDELYEELKEDVIDECNKYGQVISIEIPRLSQYGGDSTMSAAVGHIFIYYHQLEGAEKAKKAIAGRSFNGKKVEVVYYPEDLYVKNIYVVPADYFTQKAQLSAQMKSKDPDAYFNEDDDHMD